MDEKQTNRVTLEELASMIERNIAHKEDIEKTQEQIFAHIDERHNELVELVKKIPTRDEFADFKSLREQMSKVRTILREKLGVEV